MKIKMCILIVILLCFSDVIVGQDVYVTPSGSKYHLSSCRHVNNVSKEISLNQAKSKGFSACKVCNPTSSKAYSSDLIYNKPVGIARVQDVLRQAKLRAIDASERLNFAMDTAFNIIQNDLCRYHL